MGRKELKKKSSRHGYGSSRGATTVEVEVVNTWVNRIIGDMNLPDEQRKVKPQYNSWRADSPLQPSGLLGPVELLGY